VKAGIRVAVSAVRFGRRWPRAAGTQRRICSWTNSSFAASPAGALTPADASKSPRICGLRVARLRGGRLLLAVQKMTTARRAFSRLPA